MVTANVRYVLVCNHHKTFFWHYFPILFVHFSYIRWYYMKYDDAILACLVVNLLCKTIPCIGYAPLNLVD